MTDYKQMASCLRCYDVDVRCERCEYALKATDVDSDGFESIVITCDEEKRNRDAAAMLEKLIIYNTTLEALISEDKSQIPKIGDLVVKPVLCRECRWYLGTGYGNTRKCYRPNKGGNGGLKMKPDDFCSYGEKEK